MMKKILLFALVFTLLSGALAGCSPQGTSASRPSSGETAPVVINFPTAGSGGALYGPRHYQPVESGDLQCQRLRLRL